MTFIQRYFTAFFAKVNQLDRIESDLASKASSLALTATRAELGATRRDLKTLQGDVLVFQDGNNVAISLINERLSDRPTRGDLTIVASDLGARLELVETYQAALEASADLTIKTSQEVFFRRNMEGVAGFASYDAKIVNPYRS